MKDKFDELEECLARPATRRQTLRRVSFGLVATLVATSRLAPVSANDFRLGPVSDLSDPDALAACGSNGAEREVSLAVNPTNPKNVVAAWIGGGFKGIGTAVSFDGGKDWQQIVIPGVTLCTGGTSVIAGDPWLTFAPNGELYAIYNAGDILKIFGGTLATGSLRLNLVSKSTDSGLHWSSPVTLFEGTDKLTTTDKPSITADPADARFVYAIWNVLANGNRGQAVLARTTDGGRTWEPARVIYDSATSDSGTLGHQIVVSPEGALVDLFNEYKSSNAGARKNGVLSVIRSTDKGQTWSAPIRVVSLPTFDVTDPDTGALLVNNASVYPNLPSDFAMDSKNGNLYAVWEDNRFSNGQYSSIAFAMSADGGFSWSAPIQVNKTPADVASGNRQAFIPSIAVAADGTIGVTYYDFRFNDANPGLPTDYWLVHCHPSDTAPATDPANWGGELRLTEKSFDIETANNPGGGGYFLGDYEGLATVGNEFLAAWSQPHDNDLDSVFFRRVGP